MCSIDGERADVWHQTEHRARINHKCCSCGGPIEAGHVYMRTFCLYDGDVSTTKTCAVCAQVWVTFQDHHGFALEPDTLDEQLADCVDYSGALGACWFDSIAERLDYTATLDADEKMWRRLLAVVNWRKRAARREASR